MKNYFGLATEEEMRQAVFAANRKIAIKQRKREHIKKIFGAFRKIVFMPFAVGLSVVSIIAKMIGYVLAITLPYGAYQLYKVALRLYDGVPFSEIGERWLVLGFFIFPFIAFAIFVIAQGLSKYLRDNI